MYSVGRTNHKYDTRNNKGKAHISAMPRSAGNCSKGPRHTHSTISYYTNLWRLTRTSRTTTLPHSTPLRHRAPATTMPQDLVNMIQANQHGSRDSQCQEGRGGRTSPRPTRECASPPTVRHRLFLSSDKFE